MLKTLTSPQTSDFRVHPLSGQRAANVAVYAHA